MDELSMYISKYAKCRNITENEAMSHKVVKSYAEYLEEKNSCTENVEPKLKKSTTIIACGVAENCES